MPGDILAEFLGEPGDRIFTLLRRPAGSQQGCVLIVPPFAEEMNKSRRMSAQLGEALVREGIAAACVDLYGTGDSDGDFADATWQRWKSDVARAAEWCQRTAGPLVGIVGIRLGCLLAADVVAAGALQVRRTVFWQPVIEGTKMLDQFLRLRFAASLSGAGERETVADLRRRFDTGESIEVAGYDVSPNLQRALDTLRLADLAGPMSGSLDWMEVTRGAQELSASSSRAVQELRSRGCTVKVTCVEGQPFWSSTEIVTVPALVQATADAFRVSA